MSETNSCDVCYNTYTSSTRYFFHACFEIIAMTLLLTKYLAWSLYTTRFTLKDRMKIPCKLCMHPAWLHLIVPDSDSGFEPTPIQLLFKFSFQVPNPLEQQLCIKCGIRELYDAIRGKKKDIAYPADHYYTPMGNLEYLESKCK